MVTGESLMEMIFAAMIDKIDGTINDPQNSSAAQRKLQSEGEKIKNELCGNVERGWYFARRFGIDAIIRDSIDYPNLVERFEQKSRLSSNRINAWRAFVNKYIDYHGAAALVVLLDDFDVHPELTQDILHSIRMFLNHPRIITVLAGNIRSMRNSLLHLAMQRLEPSIRAVQGVDEGRIAVEWRKGELKAIEDYLEKILPPARRIVLRQPELGRSSRTTQKLDDKRTDFEKLSGSDFLTLCLSRIDAARNEFLAEKFDLAIRRELDARDVPNAAQSRALEEFLAWWVFTNQYAAPLAPRSARQIETFRDFFAPEGPLQISGQADPLPQFRTKKRLTVMLHDIPENYTLIQSLGDQDANLISWLRHQRTSSVWSGQRLFRIRGHELSQVSYSYDYIRYRLDVAIATPVRHNADELVPSGLLPRLRGRRHMRRFFQPGQMPRQQRRYGVGRWVDHAAIPGNCIYFYDLAALPDISVISETEESESERLQSGGWEASCPVDGLTSYRTSKTSFCFDILPRSFASA